MASHVWLKRQFYMKTALKGIPAAGLLLYTYVSPPTPTLKS